MRSLLVMLFALYAVQAGAIECTNSDIDASQRRLLGGTENICQTYGGKVLLVTNVASHCGYTPQYEGLEQLYKDYKAKGLVVLGFPSGDFGGQEFDDETEIAKFCKANFGVSFPMFSKSSVKGPDANPLFKRLIASSGTEPGWNFSKYLIGRDGRIIAHFPSKVAPDSPELTQALEAALARAAP